MDDLSTIIAGDEPDLILITAILPKRNVNSLSTARLSLDGYQTFFNFNPGTEQTPQTTHGVGIYVSRKLSVTEVVFNGYSHHEHVWISIKLMGHDMLLVGCIYRSPSFYTLQSTLGLCYLITEVTAHFHLLILYVLTLTILTLIGHQTLVVVTAPNYFWTLYKINTFSNM